MGDFSFLNLFYNDEDEYDDEYETEEEKERKRKLEANSRYEGLYKNLDPNEGGIDDLYRSHIESSSNDNDFDRLYSTPTGARELYSDYLSRQPKLKGPEPGFWNWMKYDDKEEEKKYARATSEWRDEGRFIDDMARTLDADRAREIRAVEHGIAAKKSQAVQDRLIENADVNREFRVDNADLSREDKIAQESTRVEDREESRAFREESRDLARSDRLSARAESRADRATAKADRDKPSPAEQKAANDLVDQHIYRTKPDLFEFEDENGKVYSKPKFIGDQIDATNLMAIRRNLLKRVLAGEVL